MFEGEKIYVFWVGLIIFALASIGLFTITWFSFIYRPYDPMSYLPLVPPIVGAIVFILIGLYMMKSGVKKEKKVQTVKISLVTQDFQPRPPLQVRTTRDGG